MQRILALIILILISPLYILISLIIVIEDGLPIHFSQKRPGKNHIIFNFYKFRSMKKNTPNVATHLLENPSQYLLKIGRIIRKLSLDELPNFINVVRGEINFVGPRPALYNQEDLLSLREKYNIDSLKPGITGWAQVNGRDGISILQKVEFEKYYLDHRNLSLDYKIIFLTLKNIIISKDVNH